MGSRKVAINEPSSGTCCHAARRPTCPKESIAVSEAQLDIKVIHRQGQDSGTSRKYSLNTKEGPGTFSSGDSWAIVS
ncbi:hypothetical protein CGCF413_v009370 [Colletotrichum fructicola]|nr:hypothetical protein CGCF413_v009370 [Colletotrichum fructicola]